MIHAILPALGGSKSVPRKNIKNLGNHPLIAYSIIACKLCEEIDRIIVSTDDEEIAKVSLSYGAEVPFMRPKEFARDDSPDEEFLRHFFEEIKCDTVVLVRPTTPLRDPLYMAEVIRTWHDVGKDVSGLRSIHESAANPYKVFKLSGDSICGGFFSDFNGNNEYSNLPRQTFPKTYEANGHIDIVKKATALSTSTFGKRIYGHVGQQIVDIDTTYDVEMAALQIGSKFDFLSEHLD